MASRWIRTVSPMTAPTENVQNFLTIHGLRFPDDPDVLRGRVRGLLRKGQYELKEFEAVQALANADDVVLELGGGIGFLSTVAARLGGVKSVHSYEANPALIPYIHAVHQANGVTNAHVTNAVLSAAQPGTTNFYVRRNLLASSLDPMQGKNDGGVVAVEQVPVENIAIAVKTIRPSVLVCDIEGAEADILPHADLSGLRCAIVELHPQWIGQSGVQAVFDAMSAAGLTYFPNRSNRKVVTFRKGW